MHITPVVEMLLTLKAPFRCLVSGSSGTGKSHLVAQIIKNSSSCIEPAPTRIIYFAGSKHSVPSSIRHLVEIREGCPTRESFQNPSHIPMLIVLDDLQNTAFSDGSVVEAFQTSRHQAVSLVIMTQNLFPRTPKARDISLNCNYFFLLYNPRETSNLYALSRQLTPQSPNMLAEVFFQNISEAYKYLFIDLTPTVPNVLRLRSNVFDPVVEIFLTEENLKRLKNDFDNEETKEKCPFDLRL